MTFQEFKDWLAQRFGAYSINYNLLPTVQHHVGMQPIELSFYISNSCQSSNIPIEKLIEIEIDGYLHITNVRYIGDYIIRGERFLLYNLEYNFATNSGLSLSSSCGGTCGSSCKGNILPKLPDDSGCAGCGDDCSGCGDTCNCEKEESIPSLYDIDRWNLPKGQSDIVCNHPNKKIVPMLNKSFWYCPDCKKDLGDA